MQRLAQLRRTTSDKAWKVDAPSWFGCRLNVFRLLSSGIRADQNKTTGFSGWLLNRVGLIKSNAGLGRLVLSIADLKNSIGCSPKQIFKQDFKNLTPGTHAVLALQLVDDIDQMRRQLQIDRFRLGVLGGQRVKHADGRLSTPARSHDLEHRG